VLKIKLLLLNSFTAFAGEGNDHSHDGEFPLWPVLVVFAVLVIAGIFLNFKNQKK
jgi:hypothetical protein